MTRILIVDDERIVTETLPQALALRMKVEVAAVSSAEEAIRALLLNPTDLVIADYAMPGTDGITLLKLVAAEFPEVRRVLLTAHNRADVRQRAHEIAHVHAIVAKPYSLTQLQRTLTQVLSEPTSSRRVPPP